MKIINKGRGQGKTIELIKISNENRYPIICSTAAKARIVKEIAEEMKLDIPKPIDIYDLLKGRRDGYRDMFKGVLIDDLKEVLEEIIKFDIKYVTTSCEVIKDEIPEENRVKFYWF